MISISIFLFQARVHAVHLRSDDVMNPETSEPQGDESVSQVLLRNERTDIVPWPIFNKDGKQSNATRRGSWDFITTHCKERYDELDSSWERMRDGDRSGYSVTLAEAGKGNPALGFRRTLVYEKCQANAELGPGFTHVDARTTDAAALRRGWVTPYEATYVEHIVRNYHDLPDWTVFVHGYPEDHNKHLFDWLVTFRRPVSSDPVYIPLSPQWVTKGVPFNARATLLNGGRRPKFPKLSAEEDPGDRGNCKETIEYCKKQRAYLHGTIHDKVNCMANAIFMVSKHAILQHSLDWWTNLQQVMFDEDNILSPETTSVHRRRRHLAASSFSAGHDLTGSRTLVEYTWSIIFGRNPQDIPPDQKFFCSWFETRTQAEVAATNLARCKKECGSDVPCVARLCLGRPDLHKVFSPCYGRGVPNPSRDPVQVVRDYQEAFSMCYATDKCFLKEAEQQLTYS